MGGKALKNTFTRRYNKEEYLKLQNYIISKLKQESFFSDIGCPKYYRNKNDFGDLDIVVAVDYNYINFQNSNINKEIKNKIQALFNPNEIVINDNCFSFNVNDFQIDIINSELEYFKSTIEYMNWADLGLLIGKIARKFNLKYGREGLIYKLSENSSSYIPISLTLNIKEILDFLGFDFRIYALGFDSKEDIFNFIVNSKFFNKNIFLDQENHTDRMRNRKRKIFIEFKEFISNDSIIDKYSFQNKDSYLDYIDCCFPKVQIFKQILQYENDINMKKAFKEKFNGNIIKNLTGLKDKELGDFINYLKKDEAYKFDKLSFILCFNQEIINNKILNDFKIFKKRK